MTANGPGALDGTSVSLAAPFDTSDPDKGLDRELERFEEQSGVSVSFIATATEAEVSRRRADGDLLPHLAVWPQPGALVTGARDGYLVGLSSYLNQEDFHATYGDYLSSLVTVGVDGQSPAASGEVYGVPVDVDVKGLVYYPRAAFERAGYSVPESWDELTALSRQMVEDGTTPWCVAFESDRSSGWPGTDWLESLVLRVNNDLSVYDDWSFHRIAFNDARVAAATELLDEVMSSPGFVRGGMGAISRLNFIVHGLLPMLGDQPECWFHHQADFMLSTLPVDTQLGSEVDFFVLPPVDPDRPTPISGGGGVLGVMADRPEERAFVQFAFGFLGAGTEIGRDIDFFVLPPIDPLRPTPVLGAGTYATVLADRPELRALLEHMASPRWGEMWAQSPGSEPSISPNARFDVSHYGAEVGEAERAV